MFASVAAPNRLRDCIRVGRPLPPEAARLDRFLYGLAQPVIGARIVLRDRQLLWSALYPALVLALFCAATALAVSRGSPDRFVRHFYRVFALLAPLPSIVFARHYSRLAAVAHEKLGFGRCKPRLESLGRAIRRAVFQAILVAAAAAPVLLLLRIIPVLGHGAVRIGVAIWAIHWIVIDAFDDARVLADSETLADVDAMNRSAPQAWFVRGYTWVSERLPAGGVLRRFSKIGDRLSLEWREELAIAESHPLLVGGFALTTAVLLATPILNLFFRPLILVASVHLLGHISQQSHSGRSGPVPQFHETHGPSLMSRVKTASPAREPL